jgi:DNA-binding IclR family transcriptional regulator
MALLAEGPGLAAGYRSSPDCELINSLARGLLVLSAFAPEDDLLGNKDIAGRTGIPKASVSRLTDTLVKLSFLEQDQQTGLYRLGRATLALGLTARRTRTLPTIAQPFIERFAIEHGVHVELGTLDGLEVRARILISGQPHDGVQLALGADFALDDTALGLASLCGLSSESRAKVLARLRTMRGARWPASAKRIEAALAQYASEGYCTLLGEWQGLTNAVAAPLSIHDGEEPLSICCVGRAATLTPDRLYDLVPYFMGLIGTIQAGARQQPRSA